MAVSNRHNTNSQQSTEFEMNRFIKVRNLVYGPYSLDRLRRFAREGRLGPTTMVSDNRDNGFGAASEDQPLQDGLTETQASSASAPGAAHHQQQVQIKPLIIHAALREASRHGFLEKLAQFGQPIQPIPGTWVIHAAASAHQVRNVLSRELDADDNLLVFEVDESQIAWFNIGETADREIRKYLTSAI